MKKIVWMLLLVATTASSEPIEFVVSGSVGSPTDVLVRQLIEKLESVLNTSVVVVNKPGGGHMVAYNYVLASTKPTLLMSTAEIVNHELYSKAFDLFTVGYFTNKMYVNSRSGIKNLPDLIELSRRRPIVFGTSGVGNHSYIAMEILCKTTIRCIDVSYKSGSEGMIAVLAGEIDTYAAVSYGIDYSQNLNYTMVHEVKLPKDRSWLKLFARNIGDRDRQKIVGMMTQQSSKFYSDMGFYK